MADINSNTNCNIQFTDEEIKVLTKAKETLKDVAKELWESYDDELEDISFFFNELSGGIENAIKGHYCLP